MRSTRICITAAAMQKLGPKPRLSSSPLQSKQLRQLPKQTVSMKVRQQKSTESRTCGCLDATIRSSGSSNFCQQEPGSRKAAAGWCGLIFWTCSYAGTILRWYKEDCSHRGHNPQGGVRWSNVTSCSLDRAKEPKHKKIGQKGGKRPWDKQHLTAVTIKVSFGLICIVC